MLVRASLCLLLIVGAMPGLTAQPDRAQDGSARPRFESVGRQAIPRDVVKALAQDRRGFLWVATGDGLVRFDGYRFQPVEREHVDPARRNLGWVRAMLAGRDGRVWISSESEGLVSYDPRTDSIVDHAQPRPGQRPHAVVALAEDLDGAIWSGTLGGGLERHPAQRGRDKPPVVRYLNRPGDQGSLPDNRVEALQVGREGTLWVGSWRGLARRLAGQERFEAIPASPAEGSKAAPSTLDERRIVTLLTAADGQIWVGTMEGDLVVVDPRSGAGRWLAPPPGPGGRGAATALVQSDDGRVWVGTSRGIEVWDSTGASRLQLLRHDTRDPGSLAANEVTTLLKDRAGAIWVGGLGIGLQRHDPLRTGISLRRALPSERFDGNVHRLLALADGRIWAATASVPLMALDERLGSPREIALSVAGSGADEVGRVEAMAADRDGRVWLASNRWLLHLGVRGQVLSRRPHGLGEVIRLLATPDGDLWLATRDGLYHLPEAAQGSGHPERVTVAGTGAGHVGEVHALALAPDGALWVGAANGLYRSPAGQSDAMVQVTSPPGQGLKHPVATGLLFDRQGTLWVDTAVAGLHRMLHWDGQNARFDPISARHGVLNRPYGINLLDDTRGRIWTQQYVYDPVSDRMTELTAADGKDFGMGWFFSYARTPDGRFLFGGTRGVLVVEPERFDESGYMPPLAVASLRIDGRQASTAGLPAELALGPEHHGLAIEFAALEFSDPQRIRYAYRLDGIDADWVETRADFRVASYGNLPPGAYALRVKASNRNGLWNPQELVIAVTVAPAWWQRSDMRALTLAAMLALLLALFRWRTRRLRQSRIELERKVGERTLELEAARTALEHKSEQLEQASLTDPLSGLRNRRFLQQHIDADVARCVRRHADGLSGPDGDLIFFMIDIDHFKMVNDRFGHDAGDAVIRELPQRLRMVFRSGDHLVRWGGEEFLIVAQQTSRAHAAALAERVRLAVGATPFTLGDKTTLSCTCSIGFACFPLDPARPERLNWDDSVRLADAALLQAKATGRNCWVGVQDLGSLFAEGMPPTNRAADWLASGLLNVQRM